MLKVTVNHKWLSTAWYYLTIVFVQLELDPGLCTRQVFCHRVTIPASTTTLIFSRKETTLLWARVGHPWLYHQTQKALGCFCSYRTCLPQLEDIFPSIHPSHSSFCAIFQSDFLKNQCCQPQHRSLRTV